MPFKRRGLTLDFKPLTVALWSDLEELFGPRGACGGCWCMFWRLKRSEFEKQKGEGNKYMLHTRFASYDRISVVSRNRLDTLPGGKPLRRLRGASHSATRVKTER